MPKLARRMSVTEMLDLSFNQRATERASESRCSGLAGVSRPRATPAIVAWTPEFRVAHHTKTPMIMYRGHCQTRIRVSTEIRTHRSAATPSHPSDMSEL